MFEDSSAIPSLAMSRGLRRTGAAVVLSLAGLIGAAGEDAAFAGGPFTGMSGAWSGVGTVSLANGTKERIRCTAQYVTKDDDNNFQQALRCKSPSYEFKVNAYVDHQAGSLTGYWTELVNNVRGEVSGKANGDHVQANLKGTGFAANLDLVTRGNSQQVTITPSSDTSTQVQKVAITLRKS